MKFLLVSLLLLCNVAFAQPSSFTIRGTVNVDTGTAILKTAFGKDIYPEEIKLEAPIKKGKFTFTGNIAYPYTVRLSLKYGGKVSERFLLDKGEQKTVWKIEGNTSVVSIDNAATKEKAELNGLLKPNEDNLHQALVALNSLPDNERTSAMGLSLQANKDSLQKERQKLLLGYLKAHPNSYVMLWEIVLATDRGHDPMLTSFYNALSPELKASATGKALGLAIENLSKTATGSVFPIMEVSDVNGNKTTIKPNGSKYTFIDFWYSGCYPCMRLFPGFKKVYDTYRGKGFEFVAISTDEGEQINDWKRAIKEKKLTWPQYLDDNKRNAHMLQIERYPTSFLLDSGGRIIAVDMLPEQLEQFLKINLP
jgi:thiol-disulfide isomerase/thioredoxin